MKNKYCKFMILITLLLCLIGCSSEPKQTTVELKFSEYYQNADDYEIIYPLLNEYFTCVQNVYEESDKVDLNSFVLPDKYDEICNQLSEISNDTSGMMIDGKLNTSDEYRTRLKLINPFLQVEVHLKGGDLIKAVNSSNEEWFSELDELLTEIYYEYENGTSK